MWVPGFDDSAFLPLSTDRTAAMDKCSVDLSMCLAELNNVTMEYGNCTCQTDSWTDFYWFSSRSPRTFIPGFQDPGNLCRSGFRPHFYLDLEYILSSGFGWASLNLTSRNKVHGGLIRSQFDLLPTTRGLAPRLAACFFLKQKIASGVPDFWKE